MSQNEKSKRYLRPLKLNKRSKDFFVFDVETGIIKEDGTIEYFLSARPESFIFGCVYGCVNGKEFIKIFHNHTELKNEFLKKRYKGKIVYAHNAEYDLSCLFNNIYLADNEAIFNGKFITMTNGICKFADSYNILPTSLKKIGEMIGLPKGQLGDANLKSHVDSIEADERYCIRDCKIVYDALKQMFEGLEPSYTIGSMALKVFRKNYLKRTIKVNKLSDSFFDCLYGGRTEAFKLGSTKAYVYDINSSYPFQMLNSTFPNPSVLKTINTPLWEDIAHLDGMVYATVTISENAYLPPLPLRYENMLIFPVGTFSGAWTIPEFAHALKWGIQHYSIDCAIVSEPMESPFKDFVTDHYAKRKASTNEFEKYFLKLYMNNLFGKMVQRTTENFKFFLKENEAVKYFRTTKEGGELVKVNGGYFAKTVMQKMHPHTIACFGAYITANARIALHNFMLQNHEHIVYCDTDSVFLEKVNPIPSSADLGRWKREDKIVTNIRALKDYVYLERGETKRMLKGVQKNAEQLNEQADVFKFKRMIKTRESFHRLDNLPAGTFIEQIKFLTGDYLKREILPDGKHTKPIKF